MTHRVTLVIDDDIMKKLREKQAKLIRDSVTNVSFSSLCNDLLRKALK